MLKKFDTILVWPGFETQARAARTNPYLRDKALAMLFFFASTRTRGAFETAAIHLGAIPAFIESRVHKFLTATPSAKWARFLAACTTALPFATLSGVWANKYVNLVAEASPVPVMNMQCEYYHPSRF